MYINLSDNHKIKMDGSCRLLNSFQLDYEEAASNDLICICEEYPSEMLSPQILDDVSEAICQKVLTTIVECLNRYSDMALSTRFWRFFLSYDFVSFVCMYYERYVLIRKVFEKYDDIVCLINPRKEKFFIAKNFCRGLIGDDYSSIISEIDWQIVSHLKLRIMEIAEGNEDPKSQIISGNISCRIRAWFHNTFNLLYKPFSEKCAVYFFNSPFDLKRRISLSIEFHDDVCFPVDYTPASPRVWIDELFRETTLRLLDFNPASEFEQLFFENLYANLPSTIVENFTYYWNESTKHFNLSNCKCIIKSGMDEFDQIRAAIVYSKGGLVVNKAHAIEESFHVRKYKTMEYSHVLLEWSDESLYTDSKMRRFGFNRLRGIEKVNYWSNRKILYIFSDAVGKYSRSPVTAEYFQVESFPVYSRIPKDLYDNLDPRIRVELVFRLRDGWKRQLKAYVEEDFEGVEIDESFKHGSPLIDKIKISRMVICETINTTSFFEALMSGVPVLVINNVKYDGLISEAMSDMIEKLRNAGIVIDDGKLAAQLINKNYDSLYAWWTEDGRKKVIDDLVNLSGIDYDYNNLENLLGELKRMANTKQE